MENIDITFGLYFDSSNKIKKINDFMEYIYKINKDFEVDFNNITLGYIDLNDKVKTKKLKFNHKNIDKVINVLDDNELIILGFDALHIPDGYWSIDTDCSISYSLINSDNTGCGYISIKFKSTLFHRILDENNFNKFVLKMINDCERINGIYTKYGIIFPMEKKKFPMLYLDGIGNEFASEDEEKRLLLWNNQRSKYSTTIRDIFYINFLNEDHFSGKREEILQKLSKIIGKESIKEFEDGRVYFNMPFDIFDYEKEKRSFDKYRKKIREIFEEYDLLMT